MDILTSFAVRKSGLPHRASSDRARSWTPPASTRSPVLTAAWIPAAYHLIGTILGDRHTVLSLSLPPDPGAKGVEQTLTLPLTEGEADGFRASARTLTNLYHALSPRAV